jgi:DNA-binding SARP family transcriptional activator
VEFRLLGPIETVDRGVSVAIRGRRQRTVLGVLALEAGRVVSVERLVDAVWGQTPPLTADRQVFNSVSALRRLLGDAIVTTPPGYRLRVGDGQLDLQVFEREAELGRAAAAAGRDDEAARRLRSALALWRGPALGGATGLSVEAARLEERRLEVLECRIDVDLRRGRHAELVAELLGLVAEQPLRERLWALLMLALYRSGRQADALGAYRELRARLVDELGIEPGPELRQLHQEILTSDRAAATEGAPAAWVPPSPPAPRQLPADIATFTGRDAECAQLELALGGDRGGAMRVAAVHGAAGIGKSAVAVHVAHALADRFEDGQLYVNLQGAGPGAGSLEPLEVLGRFLRALGVGGGNLPATLDEAAACFRSQVAGRRVLVVLDNARDAEQVEPLLPGSPTCAVLVTSRRMIASPRGAGDLRLGMLAPAEAVALLGRLAGERRLASEREAAAEVARWCGYLPLALRIAAARLASRPRWPVRALADRLANQQRRLDELELPDVGVRASFEVSHRELRDSADRLDREAAAAFGLLGVPDGPDLGVVAAACLLDRPAAGTEPVLERLVDAQLLEAQQPGRYRLHDLLRLYARERTAASLPRDEVAAALDRSLRMYTATAWRTLALLRPGDPRLARSKPRWSEGGLPFANAGAALERGRPAVRQRRGRAGARAACRSPTPGPRSSGWRRSARTWSPRSSGPRPTGPSPAPATPPRSRPRTPPRRPRARCSSRTPCSDSSRCGATGSTGSRSTRPRWRRRSASATAPPRRRSSTTSASPAGGRAATTTRSTSTSAASRCAGASATATARPAAWATSASSTSGRAASTTRRRACAEAWWCCASSAIGRASR